MLENKKIIIEEKLHHAEDGKTIDLSQEILSISNYVWLAEVIKKSRYLETILLPNVSNHDAEIILSILDNATIQNSVLTNITISNIEFNNITQALHDKIQSRLKRNKERIFGIHGGGNIGLGLMADVVAKSPFKYRILATSNNQLTSNLINQTNKLWLQHNSPHHKTTCINDITMISRELPDIIRLYTESCLVAICLTPTVIPNVAKDIAQALIKRHEIDGSGLKILILMNLPNAAQFVLEKITDELESITKEKNIIAKILAGIEFIPTVIDRIVTPITEEKIKSQLKLQLEQIDSAKLMHHLNTTNIELIINCKEILIKAISIFHLQFDLFNAEENFSMYTPNNFIEADRFPSIIKAKDLTILETVKNKYINGPHAILAWLGALFGYSTIAESIKHPVLFHFIKEMMEKEIAPILSVEYPELTENDFNLLEDSFLVRCAASVDDLVTRVGRDPMRKLDSGGRIRGTIELAQKHHLDIPTPRLEHGIAAGFLYALKEIDPTNPGCKKIMEIYKSHHNSYYDVLCYSGDAPSGKFSGLHPDKDYRLITNILDKMNIINKWRENFQHSKKSSTALVLSKVNVENQKKPIPKTLFTPSDYFLANLISKIITAKSKVDLHKSTIQSVIKTMNLYYNSRSNMWLTSKKSEDTHKNTNERKLLALKQ